MVFARRVRAVRWAVGRKGRVEKVVAQRVRAVERSAVEGG